MKPICMIEEYWRNTQLSVARFSGGCQIDGKRYLIVNKEGKDLFQCSMEAERAGREHAIPPGEPADLVRYDFIRFYKALGREKFLEVIRFFGPMNDEKELKKRMQLAVKEGKEAKKKKEEEAQGVQMQMFEGGGMCKE